MMFITCFFPVFSIVFAHPCGRDEPGYRTWLKAVDPTNPGHEYHIMASLFDEFPSQGYNLTCCWTSESYNLPPLECVEVPLGGYLEILNAVPLVNNPEVSRSRSASRRRNSRSRSVSPRVRAATTSALPASSRRDSPARAVQTNPISTLIDAIGYVNGRADTRERLYVDRSDIVFSSFVALKRVDMHRVYNHGLRVVFNGERGADVGGLLSEWISEVARAGFGSSAFVRSDTHLLSPNPAFENAPNAFEFYGRLIAIAFLEGRALGVEFAPSVLKYILGERVTAMDLLAMDRQLVTSLVRLKSLNAAELAEFAFTTTDWKGDSVELVFNGSKRALTHDSIVEYINFVTIYKLITSVGHALNDMKRGFESLFPGKIEITAEALGKRLLGETQISISQFAANVVYGSDTVDFRNITLIFWNVVKQFTQPERKMLLKFVTGSDTLPLGGFAALPRKITIEPYHVSATHLPSSSTCGLQLRLPPYKTETEMRQKILQAISGVNTFEFI